MHKAQKAQKAQRLFYMILYVGIICIRVEFSQSYVAIK